mgnify:CR=1 FL=1|tara:strand:- start:16 stop:210 length:195 start_codon:yes stop_codon:yes gene_type:complete
MTYVKITPPSTSYTKIGVQASIYSIVTPNATTWTTPSALFPLGLLYKWNVGSFLWNNLNQNWED